MENLVRHRFIYDVSRQLLLRKEPELVTVLKAEVDDAGIDLVMTFRTINRQIQMKALNRKMKGNPYAVAEALGGMQGACVIWACYDPKTLNPTVYHMMGGRGNAPMQDLCQFPQATRKKNGKKVPREGYRFVKIKDADFRNLTLDHLVNILFDISS